MAYISRDSATSSMSPRRSDTDLAGRSVVLLVYTYRKHIGTRVRFDNVDGAYV